MNCFFNQVTISLNMYQLTFFDKDNFIETTHSMCGIYAALSGDVKSSDTAIG